MAQTKTGDQQAGRVHDGGAPVHESTTTAFHADLKNTDPVKANQMVADMTGANKTDLPPAFGPKDKDMQITSPGDKPATPSTNDNAAPKAKDGSGNENSSNGLDATSVRTSWSAERPVVSTVGNSTIVGGTSETQFAQGQVQAGEKREQGNSPADSQPATTAPVKDAPPTATEAEKPAPNPHLPDVQQQDQKYKV